MFDIESVKSLEDTQKSNFYRAKVVSLDDPLNLNRVQIMIYGLTDDFEVPENVEDSPQPWCELQFRDGLMTYPNVDDVIWLFFEGGDIFRPIYFGTIYAGLDISTDKGYEKFAANIGNTTPEPIAYTAPQTSASYSFSAVADIETYRSALSTANSVETGKDIILKDTISHFDVLTKENTWGRSFQHLEPVDTSKAKSGESLWLDGRNPDYDDCPFPKREAVYPWYELRETGEGITSWKSVYGGWKIMPESDLTSGLAKFPDNVRRTYLKRYKSWTWWTINRCMKAALWVPDSNMYSRTAPKSWYFIPSSPWIYTDPEMTSVAFSKDKDGDVHSEEMGGFCRIRPSPFATMKIKDRKHYKQSTWLSYDGKSAVEMDDNDFYERLRLDFNYGEGGLEFSRAGWHGLNIWTEGSFRIRAYGRQSNGMGEGAFIPCAIEVIDTSLSIAADANLWMGGDKSANVTSLGPVGIRSKKKLVSISGGGGVTIQTEVGLSTREGVSDMNEGVQFGSPVLLGPGGDALTGGFNGWVPVLQNKNAEDAKKYFHALNKVLFMVKRLACDVGIDTLPPSPSLATLSSFCWGIYLWAKGASQMIKDIEVGTVEGVSIMGANENINVEGAGKR